MRRPNGHALRVPGTTQAERIGGAIMKARTRWLSGGALLAVIVGGAGGVAWAVPTADDDEPLTGQTLERASDAALAATGGGAVVDSEVGDDGAAYSVEVRTEDGRQLEVDLDESFKVIAQEPDDDSADATTDDADGADD
jgi:hypothetical protein